MVVILGIFYLLLLRNKDNALDNWRTAGALMGLALVISPVVHPWYLCWMLAFITIEWRAAWLALSATVIFARHIYLGYEQTGVLQITLDCLAGVCRLLPGLDCRIWLEAFEEKRIINPGNKENQSFLTILVLFVIISTGNISIMDISNI